MRPRERLFRKRIPKDAIRKALQNWSDRLSSLEEFATAVVVLGLVIEYLPSIARFLPTGMFIVVHAHAEILGELGGLFVIVGVAGELLLGSMSSRVETDLRQETDRTISEANERAANAEKAAAEANLARVQLEQRMSPRNIGDLERRALIQLLSASAGQTVDIIVFDHHIQEAKLFANLGILSLFLAAKWKCRLWESRQATNRIPGASLLIIIGEGHVDEFKNLANALAALLNKSGIDCAVSPDTFGCKGEFTPGDFHLDCEEPRQFMGLRIVAPFRIQIGAKQVVPPMPVRTFTLRPGPSTKGGAG